MLFYYPFYWCFIFMIGIFIINQNVLCGSTLSLALCDIDMWHELLMLYIEDDLEALYEKECSQQRNRGN